jgi:hypothetical protein
MAYVLNKVHEIIKDQLQANLDAAQHGTVESWEKYQFLVSWISGCEYVLEAVNEAERKLGIG